MLPRVPENLRTGLSFEVLYDAFGGKLAHWQDYINDYGIYYYYFVRTNTDGFYLVNAGGNLESKYG